MSDKAQSIRQTVGRLRASHEAMRVAQAVIHQEPEEYARATCARCGRDIDPMKLDLDIVPDRLVCPRCGEPVVMPSYLRGVVLRLPARRRFIKPWQDRSPPPPPIVAVYIDDDEVDYSAPKAITLFFVTCLATVIAMAIWTFVRAG